jgi:telomere length regulation protein
MVLGNEDDAPREIIERLKRPVEDVDTLLHLLLVPLQALGILPVQYHHYVKTSLRSESFVVAKHVPPIQVALLQHVLPSWETELTRLSLLSVIDFWFCPEILLPHEGCGEIALHAYTSLLCTPLDTPSIRYFARLRELYPAERIHGIIFHRSATDDARKHLAWEDYLQILTSAPAKIANAGATRKLTIPSSLDHGPYFGSLCVSLEKLVHMHCSSSGRGELIGEHHIAALTGNSANGIHWVLHIETMSARRLSGISAQFAFATVLFWNQSGRHSHPLGRICRFLG